MMNFHGKRVLITGSTRGIGRAAAEMFVEAGATVAVNSRNADDVSRAINEIGGTRLVAAPGDVSTVEGCRTVVDAAVAAMGGLDVLVNNASVCHRAYPMDVTEEHWDQVMNVNLKGPMFVTRFALPELRKTQGAVVMVGSALGLIAGPTDSFVYAVSKGGLVNMTRALAIELAGEGVRVNAVCPGYADTFGEQTGNLIRQRLLGLVERAVPAQRMGTTRECASAILYFASKEAAYCTGAILANDGGMVAGATAGGANAEAASSGTEKYASNYQEGRA